MALFDGYPLRDLRQSNLVLNLANAHQLHLVWLISHGLTWGNLKSSDFVQVFKRSSCGRILPVAREIGRYFGLLALLDLSQVQLEDRLHGFFAHRGNFLLVESHGITFRIPLSLVLTCPQIVILLLLLKWRGAHH